MECFVKSFSTYRTVKKATVITSALTLDSLEADTTTVTVVGTSIGRSNTGDWLIIDGSIYRISNVKPQGDRTLLTLVFPLEAFARQLELAEQPEGQTVGGFIQEMLTDHWIDCDDPVYAMKYLKISNQDSTAYAAPEPDNAGCFKLSEYCRLMRKSYRITVKFTDSGNALNCVISRAPKAARQISFEDGRSQIQSVDYSSSGTAKLTVLCGEERSTWYLSESGEATEAIPARRAAGEWKTISVKSPEEIEKKVIETFAKNKANHKLEFWSTIDLNVHDDCNFLVYGEQLQSYISYKRKSSEDKRFYYKSGELAVTATEKLRGVTS